jgi:hypothetical protein
MLVIGLTFATPLPADGPLPPVEIDLSRFSFARAEYDSMGGWGEAFYAYDGRVWQRWQTDFPEADENFSYRLEQLTAILANQRATSRRITDPDLFDFPFLYMADVGWMDLTPEEKARLREYLLRGGFIWVDDFWGQGEWRSFERAMNDILPERQWRRIPDAHPILHTVFDLPTAPQVPARSFASPYGPTYEPAGMHRYPVGSLEQVNFRGYFDHDGRLMVVATHNTDIGDGWEREAYGQWYFETFSTKSYALGVNVIVYALTH